jgi:acyl carrier protein
MQQDPVHDIRLLVHQLLKDRGNPVGVGDDESLFVGSHLDSIAAVDLIMRLEMDFGVDFSRLDFDVSLIDSIAAIASLARRSERRSSQE